MLHHILAAVSKSLIVPCRKFRKQKYPTLLHHMLKFYQLPLTNTYLTQDYSLPVFMTRKVNISPLTLTVMGFFGFLNPESTFSVFKLHNTEKGKLVARITASVSGLLVNNSSKKRG